MFDICGGSQAEEEERQLIAIEQREREETESASNIAELDAAWSEQREAIRKKVSSVAAVLGDEDAQALVEAKLENKQTLIALLLQEYTDLSVRQKLNTLSAYLSEALPKLLELQEKAKQYPAA